MVTEFNKSKVSTGRKSSLVNWDEAKKMRDKYKRIGEIAKHFNVSDSVISAGFKKRGIK
jgi:hypothetical protein